MVLTGQRHMGMEGAQLRWSKDLQLWEPVDEAYRRISEHIVSKRLPMSPDQRLQVTTSPPIYA